jgi:radical SAM protein (TIGR01212 family)
MDKFGVRVHKIPVNAGFTCPNRDGKVAFGGCTYCNIDSFTRKGARANIPIHAQVSSSIGYFKKRYKAKAFIVYFQPYSNTYASLDQLTRLYDEALSHPEIVGIAIGTRPDCIDAEKLDYFQTLAERLFVTIEYGIESAFDETLHLINRGHDFHCTKEAIQKTAERGIHVGGHIVLGFPNECRRQMMTTIEQVSRLPLSFLKLHNLHIVRYTEMARQFQKQPFPIFSFDEWVDMACLVIERLHPEFIIERLHGDAPRHLLIEPQWCRNSAKIIRAIQLELAKRDTFQGKYYDPEFSLAYGCQVI